MRVEGVVVDRIQAIGGYFEFELDMWGGGKVA